MALFTIFNFADLAGKSLPMWQALVFTHHQSIMWCAVARVLFIPAFWVAARHSLGPVVIVILALSLGLSNGYCTALAMMAGPNGLEVNRLHPLQNAEQHALQSCMSAMVEHIVTLISCS